VGAPAASPFGALLRQWRGLRGLSQLALAAEAATTTRHLSFLETGRASPSREMVLRLSEALDVPLRERNALLEAAGFASVYRETPFDAVELGPIRRVIALLLEASEPFPSVVVTLGAGPDSVAAPARSAAAISGWIGQTASRAGVASPANSAAAERNSTNRATVRAASRLAEAVSAVEATPVISAATRSGMTVIRSALSQSVPTGWAAATTCVAADPPTAANAAPTAMPANRLATTRTVGDMGDLSAGSPGIGLG